MARGFLRKPKTLDQIQEEGEMATAELDLAEKRALLRNAEQQYGGREEVKRRFPGIKSGIDWDSLKFRAK